MTWFFATPYYRVRLMTADNDSTNMAIWQGATAFGGEAREVM